jgi:hypothetical protein
MLRPSRRALVRVVLPVTALALAAGAVVGFARHGAGAPAPASAAPAAVDDVSTGEAAALLADVQDASGAPLRGQAYLDKYARDADAASRIAIASR